jgi:ribonuclease BN (tRNA processing enzyme)
MLVPLPVRVIALGTGDAFCAAGRGHAAFLLETPSTRILVDCGPTALLGLKRRGLTSADIDTVLVSHLHGDHFGGIPFLLLECVFETPRKGPLTVLGPPHTDERIQDVYRGMYKELSARPLPFEYRCIELQPGECTRLGQIEVVPFRTQHQKTEIALGFRVTVEGKTILYSGDTGWSEALIALSQGVDLFICECSYFDRRVDFHLDYRRLAANHHRFGCRRLLLTHVGREMLEHRDEVDLEIAEDGMVVEI